MTFELTKKVLMPIKPDYRVLEYELKEYAETVKFKAIFRDTLRTVSYYVHCSFNDQVSISIIFPNEPRRKYPSAYGSKFREECIEFAISKAAEILNEYRMSLSVTIKEENSDWQSNTIEERTYVRK